MDEVTTPQARDVAQTQMVIKALPGHVEFSAEAGIAMLFLRLKPSVARRLASDLNSAADAVEAN